MSAAGRNIFAVLAQRTGSYVSGPEKAQDTLLDRLIVLLREGDDAEIESLLEKSSDQLVRNKDENGWSLLHHAAKLGRAEATELLLEVGAYANARDNDENTPLHIACLSRAAAVAHRLILYGADVEVRNKDGKTPLQLSEKGRCAPSLLLTRLLCNPRAALLFPSRLGFEMTFKAFSSSGCGAEWEQPYHRHVCDNIDDFYPLFCVVRSHGGNRQCSIGNKWDAVQTELDNSSQASACSGNYQLTFHMYLRRYESYYGKTIARLNTKRTRFIPGRCVMEKRPTSNGVQYHHRNAITRTDPGAMRLSSMMGKHQGVERSINTKSEGKTVFDMLNLSPVVSGYSSSLRVFDTTSFERFDLSVNGLPEKPRSTRPSSQRDNSRSLMKVEEVDFSSTSPKALRNQIVEQTTLGIENGALFEHVPRSRGYNGLDSDRNVFPLTIGFSDDKTCGAGLLQLCSPSSVYSDGADSEGVEGKMFGRSSVWDTSFNNLVGRWTSRQDDCKESCHDRNGLKRMDKCSLAHNGIPYDYVHKHVDTVHDELQVPVLSSYGARPAFVPEEDNDGSDLELPFGTENGAVYRNAKRAENSYRDDAHPCDEERLAVAVNQGETAWRKRKRKHHCRAILDSDDEAVVPLANKSYKGSGDDASSPGSSVDVSSMPSSFEGLSESKVDVQKRLHGMVPRRGVGECMLHVTARCGDLAAVQYLLERGTPVNARDHAGWTPLHEAVREGHVHVAEFLIHHGAEVNAGSSDGTRPLHDASESNDVRAVIMLLESGAVATAENYSGETAYVLTSSQQVRSILEEYTCSSKSALLLDSSDGEDKQLSNVDSDGSYQSPAPLISGQYSYGPMFETWERPPPLLLCMSFCDEEPNRRYSCVLLSDLLDFLDSDEATLTSSWPEVEVKEVSNVVFRSQVSGLLLSQCEVNAPSEATNAAVTKLVRYSDRVREILGGHVQLLDEQR